MGIRRPPSAAVRAFRDTPRDELLDRLDGDRTKMLDIFESLTAEEWGGLIVAGPAMAGTATARQATWHGRRRSTPLAMALYPSSS